MDENTFFETTSSAMFQHLNALETGNEMSCDHSVQRRHGKLDSSLYMQKLHTALLILFLKISNLLTYS